MPALTRHVFLPPPPPPPFCSSLPACGSSPEGASPIVRGLRDGVIAMLTNGVSLGALIGLIMNIILPPTPPEELQKANTFGEQLRSMSIHLSAYLSKPRSQVVAPVLACDSKIEMPDGVAEEQLTEGQHSTGGDDEIALGSSCVVVNGNGLNDHKSSETVSDKV